MSSLMSTDIAWEQIFAFILDRAPSGVIPFKVHATCKNSYVLNHSNLTRTWHELFTVPPGFQPIPMNQGGLAILDRDRYVHSSVCFERLGFSKLSKFAKIFFYNETTSSPAFKPVQNVTTSITTSRKCNLFLANQLLILPLNPVNARLMSRCHRFRIW